MLVYNEGALKGNIKKTNIVISDSEIKEIIDTDKILIKTSIENNSYLAPLLKLGCSNYMISPLKDKDDILGAICIGMINEPQDRDVVVDHLSEISDRAAVALSNANWEKKLLHQANFDALTKLPNRYLFHDRLEQALERAKRKELNVAVLFIDLDRFKSVNDSLGHVIGDQLLVGVSSVLLNCVRSCDSVSRFGGDEFTIIVSDVSNEEVDEQTSTLSDRIIEMMSQPIIINDREFYISPSIGIAIYPRDANNFNDLLKNADTAMYEAKNISSGNYQFYQKQQNKETLARLELENDLRHALEEGQLELYYQPKINLRNCMIYDVEALARWKHPDHGYVSPTVFIPLAEETGLIVSIGYWVMRTACMQNKAWRDKGINLNVAVNVSADQFRQPQLYEKMVNIIEETGVNPNSIELEITESITIEDFSKTINVLNKFREHGLGICIDDFGTGYSSMTYLQKISFNKLKIDKSFIDNIHLDNDSASITKAILALAHNLDLKVVAEGVETKAQYDYLNAINCDEAQGFFLSRPLPADELIQHILLYNNRSTKID
jgi:diguanylate cyclase (GGDEF)-like protein